MAREFTFNGTLRAQRTDFMGYTTYVFENFESAEASDKYIMCVRFPGWDEKELAVGDTGFVSVRYVSGGADSWFDGRKFVPYAKTDVHFLKFVPAESDIVLDF